MIPEVKESMFDLGIGPHMLGKGFGGNSSSYWASDFGEIYVNFDDHGKATSMAFTKPSTRVKR
ncbi:MAG: hypothetical protein ACJ8FY_28925 [Gemmataceae bacterium]